MNKFLQGQCDYIFFICGLALCALAVGVLSPRLFTTARDGSSFRCRNAYIRRLGLAILVLVCLGWVLTHFLGNIAKSEVEGDGVDHLRILTQEVTNAFKEAEQIVKNLSESPLIVSALSSDDPIALERANTVLDRYNNNFNLAVCYLLDVDGKAIASSNRHAPDSFVGVSYRFRPYYQQPMQGSWGHHFAMGIRTHKRGYFVSYPVKDAAAKVIGIAVLKVDVDYLEKKIISSNRNKPPALVIDNYGLVVISTQPDLLFKTLWPVPEDIRRILLEQYRLKDVSSIFSQAYTSGSDVLLEQQHYLLFMNNAYTNSKINWSLACLTPYTAIARYRLVGMLITFILISLAVMYAYRNLWLNELNETLERRVIERTAALQKSEEKYRSIFENAMIGIFQSSPARRFLSVNPTMAASLGYDSPGEAIAAIEDIAAQVYAEPQIRREITRRLREGQGAAKLEVNYLHRDGNHGIGILYIRTVRDPQGKLLYYEGVTQDITERKQAEEALAKKHRELQETTQRLEQSRNMLQLIIESIPVRVFWKSRDLRYLGCNTLFAHDAGFTHPQQLLGLDDFAMGWKEQAELYRADDLQVMDSGLPKLNIIEPQTTPAGANIWLNTNKVPLQKPDGEVFGVLGVYEDITERKQAVEALRESESRAKAMLQAIPDLVFRLDSQGFFLDYKAAINDLYAQSEPTLIGKRNRDLTPPEFADLIERQIRTTLETLTLQTFEYQLPIPGRGVRDYEARMVASGADEVTAIVRDVTERKRIEEALTNAKKQWEGTFDAISDWVCILDKDQHIVRSNKSADKFCGYSVSELIGKHCYEIVHGQNDPILDCPATRAFKSRQREELEFHLKDSRWWHISVYPIEFSHDQNEFSVHIVRDITARKQAEETIKASLQEKEVLLKELYHRTKNNLQVVSSLLKLQSSRFSDPTVQHAFQDTINRIWSMTKVHEKLYQSKNLAYIDLKDYIKELTNFLLINYQTEYGKISLHLDLQSVIVDFNTAMPCGLIINELVSNAIKYAFPGGRKGTISIFLGTTPDHNVELRVADDGVGLPPELDLRHIGSLGLTLAIDLAKRQLHGEVEVRREQGMEFRLLFKELNPKPKV